LTFVRTRCRMTHEFVGLFEVAGFKLQGVWSKNLVELYQKIVDLKFIL